MENKKRSEFRNLSSECGEINKKYITIQQQNKQSFALQLALWRKAESLLHNSSGSCFSLDYSNRSYYL